MPQTDPSIEFTAARLKAKLPEPIAKVEIDLTGDVFTPVIDVLDISSISRSVQFDTGKFSPGDCSVDIDNKNNLWSDQNPSGLTSGNRYLGKKIRVSLGFRNVSGALDFLPQFDGIIESKKDDVNERVISLSAYDIFKNLLDFKIGKKKQGKDFFTYENATSEDLREIQLQIIMGKHDFPNNRTKERLIREDPFNVVLTKPAIDGTTIGGSGRAKISGGNYQDYGVLWLVPIDNEFDTINADTDIYFWDYIRKYWVKLAGTGQRSILTAGDFKFVSFERNVKQFSHGGMTGSMIAGDSVTGKDSNATAEIDSINASLIYLKNIVGYFQAGEQVYKTLNVDYVVISNTGTYIQTDEFARSISWSDYIHGLGSWAGDETPNADLDPAVAVRIFTDTSKTVQASTLPNLNNPACQILYLLASPRYLTLDLTLNTGLIDFKSFSSPDETYSFDKSFRILDDAEVKSCVTIKTIKDLLSTMEEICAITNMIFFSTERIAEGQDRRIKLHSDQPIFEPDALVIGPENTNGIKLSTELKSMFNKISIIGFDYLLNLGRDNFDSYIAEDAASQLAYGLIEKRIGADNLQGNVILYDSRNFAEYLIKRILLRMSEPEANADIEGDFIFLPHYIKADLIILKDSFSGLDADYQIKSKRVDFGSGKINLTLSRFGKTFGPDFTDKKKKWGFADYAYIDEDLEGNKYYAY